MLGSAHVCCARVCVTRQRTSRQVHNSSKAQRRLTVGRQQRPLLLSAHARVTAVRRSSRRALHNAAADACNHSLTGFFHSAGERELRCAPWHATYSHRKAC